MNTDIVIEGRTPDGRPVILTPEQTRVVRLLRGELDGDPAAVAGIGAEFLTWPKQGGKSTVIATVAWLEGTEVQRRPVGDEQVADHRGRAAYAAYGNAVGGRTHDGGPLPTWDALAEQTRRGWIAAAMSGRHRVQPGERTPVPGSWSWTDAFSLPGTIHVQPSFLDHAGAVFVGLERDGFEMGMWLPRDRVVPFIAAVKAADETAAQDRDDDLEGP